MLPPLLLCFFVGMCLGPETTKTPQTPLPRIAGPEAKRLKREAQEEMARNLGVPAAEPQLHLSWWLLGSMFALLLMVV